MLNRKSMFLLVVVGCLMLFASVAANAQSVAIVTNNNNCLIPGGDRVLRVFKCTDGGIRYSVNNGRISTSDNFCVDHGVVKGSNPSNDARAVKLVPCHNGKSQQWYIIGSGRGVGLVQNAVNPDVCLNIEGGNDSPGTRVLVWGCGYNNPAANERFYFGGRMSSTGVSYLPKSAITTLDNGKGGSVIMSGGARIIAAGAGNIIAAGAGNLVAAGAGNIIAAGGGNLIGLDGSTLIPRLIGNDGAGLRGQTVSSTFRP